LFNISQSDNLIFLNTLQSDSVDLIYSDILYGTGKKFKDFKDLSSHKDVIYEFYYPRIQEMCRVLKSSGSIYLQMDYRINHWIRDILDSTFGYNNFRNEIIWHYNSAPRKKGCFGNRHDTILRYSKSDIFTFNDDVVREPYALSAPRGYEKEKYYHPLGKVLGDVWQINMLGQNDKTERVGYDTQKPLSLMDRIIKASSNEGDLVADFFLGSGTTAVSAIKLGRNFVGCDISEKAINITKNRLENVG
jgi:site-specific DNA-methyltransferase (adenine-specific)